MRCLIVVTGPPGAGKSTVSGVLASLSTPSALVQGDQFFGLLRQGAIDPWLDDAAEQNECVMRAAAATAGQLATRFGVVYDGIVRPRDLSDFVSDAGVEWIDYAVLVPPLEVCLERVRTRVSHGFNDAAAAEGMWNDFAQGVGGLANHVVDWSTDPMTIANAIAGRAGAGTLRFPAAPPPSRV